MNLRLKTNLEVEKKLTELQSSLQLSSKAAVMRLAIGYSLKINDDPRYENSQYSPYDIKKQNGTDYNRYTIFGEDELVYKVLMQQHINQNVNDEIFFPELTNAHITRGIRELYADFKLANSKEKFIKKLLYNN